MSDFTVEVQARYIEKESDPSADRYVFAYTITIRNEGSSAGQLLNRHWWVTDAQGDVQEVRGPGVVGEQPHIAPGGSFRYTSAALIATPVGAMHGHYEFQRDDGEQFEVAIPAFSLCIPSLVH
ncbi:MAG: Co2+/Mg2+ efflux protein ApaG [Pseudomonadales bacterium]